MFLNRKLKIRSCFLLLAGSTIIVLAIVLHIAAYFLRINAFECYKPFKLKQGRTTRVTFKPRSQDCYIYFTLDTPLRLKDRRSRQREPGSLSDPIQETLKEYWKEQTTLRWTLLQNDRKLKNGWFFFPGACLGNTSRWNAHYIYGKSVYCFNTNNKYTIVIKVDEDKPCPPVSKFYPSVVVQAFDAPKANILCSWRYRETRSSVMFGLLLLGSGILKNRLDKKRKIQHTDKIGHLLHKL